MAAMSDVHPNLRLVEHPLTDHFLTEARDAQTSSPRFRELLRRLGIVLTAEASRDLPTHPRRVQTPLEPFDGRRLHLPITIVPILRAGLGLVDGMLTVLPEAQVGHLGMFRDEDKVVPISYYQKLPDNIAEGVVLLVDPMLATGGSAAAGIDVLRKYGCDDVRLVCLVAAPEGVTRLARQHPDVPIVAAALDRQLNDIGYILPGLGDAGDRMFGTM